MTDPLIRATEIGAPRNVLIEIRGTMMMVSVMRAYDRVIVGNVTRPLVKAPDSGCNRVTLTRFAIPSVHLYSNFPESQSVSVVRNCTPHPSPFGRKTLCTRDRSSIFFFFVFSSPSLQRIHEYRSKVSLFRSNFRKIFPPCGTTINEFNFLSLLYRIHTRTTYIHVSIYIRTRTSR